MDTQATTVAHLATERQDGARASREDWLMAAVAALRPVFAARGYTIPEQVKVACGFPSRAARAMSKRRVGECWSPKASAAANHEILVSPVLADPQEVIGTLGHELAHAAVGVEHGHRAPFARCVKALGCENSLPA